MPFPLLKVSADRSSFLFIYLFLCRLETLTEALSSRHSNTVSCFTCITIMYVCACMRVCVHACVRACVCVCVHVCFFYMCAYEYFEVFVCVCACVVDVESRHLHKEGPSVITN